MSLTVGRDPKEAIAPSAVALGRGRPTDWVGVGTWG